MKDVGFIEADTLICEYVGNLFFLKDKLFSKNDFILDLIISQKYDKSLVTYPKNITIWQDL